MSISEPTTQSRQWVARTELSLYVSEQAGRAAHELGFGWIGVSEAPSTYQQLRAAFRHSQLTGDPLLVSCLFCERTVFSSSEVNVAFRFWHDTAHCRLGLSFELPDEWELALWHLDQLERGGFSNDTDEYQLLRFDLLGQIILLGITGRFPFNQQDFTLTCGLLGIDAGIMAELRRLS